MSIGYLSKWAGTWAILAGLAASAASAADPLRIEDMGIRGERGRAEIAYRLISQSQQDVLAYIVRVEFSDKGTVVHTASRMVALAAKPGGKHMGTGETREERISGGYAYGTDGAPLPYRLAVDSVLLADGTILGPDVTKQGQKLRGVWIGMNLERGDLKRLMAASGMEAVRQELGRE